MIDHTGIGVADVARSAAFYDAALGALGLRRVAQMPANDGADGVGYGVDYPVFWIDRFHPHGVKQHTAFAARNRAEVDAFHAAALKAGGTDNGPPASRHQNRPPARLLRSLRARSGRQQHGGGVPRRLKPSRKFKLRHYRQFTALSSGLTQQTRWLLHGVINHLSTACPPGCQPVVAAVAARVCAGAAMLKFLPGALAV
jgi:catechol 2,3-dioxygenase-like lactoylglutathione lyase family enzyme